MINSKDPMVIIEYLQALIKMKDQQIIALRRSLIEARTFVVNNCDISEKERVDYLEWLTNSEEDNIA